MKFTTSLALSGLIASSLAAPSRPNQARGHRQSLQKSQSSAGGFAQPSGSGFSGGFGGQGGQGGRARPTGSYGGWGSQQSSAAGFAQPSGGFSGSGSGFGSGSGSQSSVAGAAPTGTGGFSGSASSVAVAPIASSAAPIVSSAAAPVASSIASSAVIDIASSSTKTKSSSSTATKAATATANTDDEYNVSWAGAVLDDGGKTIYTGVYSEFTIPVPTKPTAGETDAEVWTVSSWVGIDGYSQGSDCQGLWQAGVDASIDSSGTVTYDPWYEWYPAGTLGFDLTVTAGDVIAVNLTYSTFTEGSVTMENKSTGKSQTKTVTSTDVLCGQAAEWIMEDLSIDGSTIGLANYGNVTFTNAYATTSDGTQVGPSGALLMDIETTSNEILTSSSVTEDSVTVAYV